MRCCASACCCVERGDLLLLARGLRLLVLQLALDLREALLGHGGVLRGGGDALVQLADVLLRGGQRRFELGLGRLELVEVLLAGLELGLRRPATARRTARGCCRSSSSDRRMSSTRSWSRGVLPATSGTGACRG